MATYEDIRTINAVLNFYYVEKLTQSDIAERLDLSTAKVNRLLQYARDQGYVQFIIRTPFQNLFDLENRLKAVFGLQDAIVIPAVGTSGSSMLNSIGAVAAEFFLEKVRDGDIVAITPGTTVGAVAQALDASRPYKVEIVPMLGAIQGDIESDMNYIATHMAERMGSKSYQLHAPAYVDTKEHCEIVKSMSPVKDILEIARKADVAILGVGTVKPDTSRFVEFTALSAEDMNRIAEKCGGVGEISAHIYNIEGEACGKTYAERVVGLSLEEIKKISYRIGVAATAEKAMPIYGALRGGYLHALITDEPAARGVLDIFDKNFSGKN